MKTVYPPHKIGQPHVFLAGTIDNGDSRDWQSELVRELNSYLDEVGTSEDFVFANPRRPDWNTNWHGNHPELVRQIEWELDAMHSADAIFMWFEPNSKSPITLLELGLFSDSDNLVVGCPPKFYRYQNVVTSTRWARNKFRVDLPLAHGWDTFVLACKDKLRAEYTTVDGWTSKFG